ncbi:MAG TPA: UvrD-helicase domain-containing protein [Clostridiaceae bacterium]
MYDNLNNEQKEAVLTTQGPVLILAGAGSGKTTAIVNRIAHLIKNLGVYPSQILAITFTNKASQEMKNRVKNLIGEDAINMWVTTFHASCVRILRREIDKLGYTKNFIIYDTYDQKTLIKDCIKELGINDKEITDKEIKNKIGEAKDNLISPDEFKNINQGNYRNNKIADAYLLYQKKLKLNNAVDFDDIICKTVELFIKNPEVLSFYQRKFKYVMVDEYQDTNKAQYELVYLLAKEHKNICVVGDDDQCIYEWRGANIRNILDFEKDYPGTKIIKLEQNYRSKSNILNAANGMIVKNHNRKDKTLRTEKEAGDKIKIYKAYSDINEGSFIAGQIKKLIDQDGKNLKDFAILYRTNAQSRIFEDSFNRIGIPYRILGGLKFYDRKEIKDILSYVKFLYNSSDDVSLRRIINVPKRSIGDTTVAKLQEFASNLDIPLFEAIDFINQDEKFSSRNTTALNKFYQMILNLKSKTELSVPELITEILKDTGYLEELKKSPDVEDRSRIENLEELVSAAAQFDESSEDKSLEAFLEKVTLVSDIDNYDETADTVVLMTVHSAKGLEFPVVFMVGMENGLFPGTSSFDNIEEMEESRRLCYVGITRAKELLYMSHATTRTVFGRTSSYAISDFIEEIPKDLKIYIGEETPVYHKMVKEDSVHSLRSLYKTDLKDKVETVIKHKDDGKAIPGQKVKHIKFGVGTIIKADSDGNCVKLTIAFDNMGIKTLMLDIAPLEFI